MTILEEANDEQDEDGWIQESDVWQHDKQK